MRRECLPLGLENRRGVDQQIRLHRPAEFIHQAVWHGVVHGDFAVDRRAGRLYVKIGHAAGKRRRHREAGGVGVILHIILRRMGEYDRRVDISDNRCQSTQV